MAAFFGEAVNQSSSGQHCSCLFIAEHWSKLEFLRTRGSEWSSAELVGDVLVLRGHSSQHCYCFVPPSCRAPGFILSPVLKYPPVSPITAFMDSRPVQGNSSWYPLCYLSASYTLLDVNMMNHPTAPGCGLCCGTLTKPLGLGIHFC